MPDEAPKKTRAPLRGMALQTDIIKKIGFQLDRLGDEPEMAGNILDFLSRALRKKIAASMVATNGQLPLGANPAQTATPLAHLENGKKSSLFDEDPWS